MSFLGLGSLFGGGSTTVQQQAANTTNTNVDLTIQNIMDLTGITEVLKWLGLKEEATAQATADQQAQTATDLVAALNQANAAKLQQEKAIFDNVLPWVKAVSAAMVIFLLAKTFTTWKRKK